MRRARMVLMYMANVRHANAVAAKAIEMEEAMAMLMASSVSI